MASSDEPRKPPVDSNVAKLSDAKLKKKRGRQPPPPGMPTDVYDRLEYGRDGPKATAFNVALVLSEHPDWQGVFALDDFAQTVMVLRAPPCVGKAGEFTNEAVTEISIWMSNLAHAGINCNDDLVKRVVKALAARARFHVVREYLEKLTWDGEDRLDRFFADYCGADYNNYTATVARMVLVSAVARVFDPGCRVNFMLILEGYTQIGKSWLISILFGKTWSCEALESPTHKDFFQSLIGQWAVEIPEMHSFSKSDINKVKQVITQPTDVYRKSYDDKARRWPRQCVFVGTTEEEEYLTDPRGAARFLPVRVTGVDTEKLAADRDQLWAQAVVLYRDGFRYWQLPPEAKEEQDKRYRADSWEEPIIRWLDGKAPDSLYPPMERDHQDGLPRADGQQANFARVINATTTTELMKFALGMDLGKHTRQDQMRIASIMRRLQWEKGRASAEAVRTYVFKRPPEPAGGGS